MCRIINIKLIFWLVLSLFIVSCTTQKNTFFTRNYHAFVSYYNIYFNGYEAYNEAKNKIDNYPDDFSYEILPIFKYYYKEARIAIKPQLERAIIKMSKVISNHSITVKPNVKGNLTPKDIDFLKKYEYNVFIDDAYLLNAKANFLKNDFEKAYNSLRLIINNFGKSYNTYFEAKLWLARLFLMDKRFEDAELYLEQLLDQKKLDKQIVLDTYLSLADLNIQKENYELALFYLKKAENLAPKILKQRILFIISQIYLKNLQNDSATIYLKKVIKVSDNNEYSFYSKIFLASVAGKNDFKKTYSNLQKILNDKKNESYKDIIYYALGNLFLSNYDTSSALNNFKSSLKTSKTQSVKIKTLKTLANLYYQKKEYYLAAKYYDSLLVLIKEDNPEYAFLKNRYNNLYELLSFFEKIYEQDSLQKLALLPENERKKIIDSIYNAKTNTNINTFQQSNIDYFDVTTTPDFSSGSWYMYNNILVSKGKQDFRKKWGNRKLEDNWRRSNKSSILNGQITSKTDSINKQIFSYETLLKNIPLTPQQKKLSDSIIIYSYFNISSIYALKLNEYQLAIDILKKILSFYPENNLLEEIYFRLFIYNTQLKNFVEANYYKELLIIKFPNSKYSKAIQDPRLFENLIVSKEKVLNLLDTIYSFYNQNKYSDVIKLCNFALSQTSDFDILPYLYFYKAKAYGNLNQKDSMFYYFDIIIRRYKDSPIANVVTEIVQLSSKSKYDFDIYINYFNEKHFICFIFPKNSNITEFIFKLKTKVNNFSQIQYYNIDTIQFDNYNLIIRISDLKDKAEALSMYNYLLANFSTESIENYKVFAISEKNYQVFLKDRFIEKYLYYFEKNYLKN